ncbi:hypothetical protein SKAU_G00423390 [Synaphobranchus kaupii]|uniref:Uncharacterized protein n=1 Tax=Synaphobranchus kaupii TaxID=118154 RepID=A0A9Q1I9R9_SYNKA|nr:hypothetical protein SKAU_G00423390 [Synaphobranchus kaupii]
MLNEVAQESLACETMVEEHAALPPSKQRKKEDVKAWKEIRDGLHLSAVESLCLPEDPHCAICQGPLEGLAIWRYREGTGLADGEQSERLWSYLRKFGKITKEMTPSHRSDLLTDALLHYSKKVERKQITLLPQRWAKATKVKEEARAEFTALLQSVPGTTITAVRGWGEDLANSLEKTSISLSWEEACVENLHQLELGRTQLEAPRGGAQVLEVVKRTERARRQVDILERRHRVRQRWSLTTTDSEQYLTAAMEKRAQAVLDSVSNLAFERKFMCGLMAKVFFVDKDHSVSHDAAFQLKQRLFVLLSLHDRASEEMNIIQRDLSAELGKIEEALRNPPCAKSLRHEAGVVSALSLKIRECRDQLQQCDIVEQLLVTNSSLVESEVEDLSEEEEEEGGGRGRRRNRMKTIKKV